MKKMLLALVVLGFAVAAARGQQKTDQPVSLPPSSLPPLPRPDIKPKEPMAPGTVRVAVVNVGLIFNQYKKAQLVKAELEEALRPFKNKAKVMVEQLKTWEQESKTPGIAPPRKDDLDSKILKTKHQLEEMQQQVQKLISKRQEENLVVLWKEVRQAVQTYAQQNNIQLVLAYGDPVEKDALEQFPNINRKMQAMDQGGTLPIFIAPGVDIAEPVVEMLNRQYRENSKKSPAKAIDL